MSMQRPIMNPTWVDMDVAPVRRTWWDRLRPLRRIVRFVGKILLWDPLTRTRFRGLRIEDGTPWERFCRGLLYRLTFLPVFAALTVAAMVYAGTHPPQNTNEIDPNSQGIYYEPVTLKTEDDVRLEAWLIPVLEADQVLRQKEMALKMSHPAVLLVHDYGRDRQQMLPLVKPLHEAGFVVMVLATRGCGQSASAGSTFGLLEENDLNAALAVLKKRTFVDEKRIAIVGVGAGASAALTTADDDPEIKALVLDHPAQSGDQVLEQHVCPHYPALNWMKPLCKWAFELVYQVHAHELDLTQYRDLMNKRKVLMVDAAKRPADFTPSAAKGICRFLSANLLPEDVAAVDLGSHQKN
jgi:pimeloyl-ACP methyl ester carboxylesterase